MVLFCLKKLRCYYRHHDTIKYNILKGSKIILYVINHSLPREGLCQKVTNVSIKIVKTNTQGSLQLICLKCPSWEIWITITLLESIVKKKTGNLNMMFRIYLQKNS